MFAQLGLAPQTIYCTTRKKRCKSWSKSISEQDARRRGSHRRSSGNDKVQLSGQYLCPLGIDPVCILDFWTSNDEGNNSQEFCVDSKIRI